MAGKRKFIAVLMGLTSLSCATLSANAFDGPSLSDAIKDSQLMFDGRFRYEFADFENFERDANALTFRGKFGFKTGNFHGFEGLIEGDFTRDLGIGNFNSTTNGQTEFPVVADPNSERLNRFQISYNGFEGTKITFGRQRIKLDNDRFIGNVGFRQNEQTYDAVRLTNTSIQNLKIDYSYLWQVNKIFGSNSANGRTDSNSHLFNAGYQLPFGKIAAYAYLLDIEDFGNSSNETYGVRANLSPKLNDEFSILFDGEYATQSEFGNSPDNFNLDYYLVDAGVKWNALSLKAGIEVLEGNGARGFVTPLATLHKFQGFVDIFLNTPANGIEDRRVMVGYRFADVGGLGAVNLSVRYHDFDSDIGNQDFGQEFDLVASANPWKNVTLRLKYGDFNSDILPDARRLFLTVGFKY